MTAPIHIDLTPMPIQEFADRMGRTPDYLVALHREGAFPPLKMIGRRWYVMPAALLLWQMDNGDLSREAAGVGGDVATTGGEETVLPLETRGEGRGRAEGRGQTRMGKWTNPL